MQASARPARAFRFDSFRVKLQRGKITLINVRDVEQQRRFSSFPQQSQDSEAIQKVPH